MQIVLAILYVLMGVLMAVPYCLLAGWNTESFMLVALAAPAFLFVWFITASFAGVIESGYRRMFRVNWRTALGKTDHRMLSGYLPLFWAWTLFSFLPVILHWSAVLLAKVGYEKVSLFVDEHRYASPLYVFMAAIALLIIIVMVTSVWDAVKGVWTRIVQ